NYVNTVTLDPQVDSTSVVGIKPTGGFVTPILNIGTITPSSPWVSSGRAMRFTAPPIGSEIRGVKFNDLNRNGVQDAGEPTLAGWQVFLDQNGNGSFDSGEPTQVTDADGKYAFTNLTPGTYYVGEVVQPGWVRSRPGPGGTISNGGFETGDFTGWSIAGAVSIQGLYGVQPTEGGKQVLMHTFGKVPTAAALESFLGLNSGTLTTIGGINAVQGSAIKR